MTLIKKITLRSDNFFLRVRMSFMTLKIWQSVFLLCFVAVDNHGFFFANIYFIVFLFLGAAYQFYAK